MHNASKDFLEDELVSLKDRHADFEKEINKIYSRKWMSDQEYIRMKNLKKMKLNLKDRMVKIIFAITKLDC